MAIEQYVWENSELLRENRLRLQKTLRRKLREYESRYELASDRVEGEIAGGRLRETAEICDWVIALQTLRALER